MLLNCFLAPEAMQVGQGLLKHEIPWFLGLVFDTGLSVTPLMGHLVCLASHWSVPVLLVLQIESPKSVNQTPSGKSSLELSWTKSGTL